MPKFYIIYLPFPFVVNKPLKGKHYFHFVRFVPFLFLLHHWNSQPKDEIRKINLKAEPIDSIFLSIFPLKCFRWIIFHFSEKRKLMSCASHNANEHWKYQRIHLFVMISLTGGGDQCSVKSWHTQSQCYAPAHSLLWGHLEYSQPQP